LWRPFRAPARFLVMDDLAQLYQDIILDHYKHPRHKAGLKDPDVLADEENPLCGDHIRLTACLRDGRVEDVYFDGKGCAISQASASMMCEAVRGKTPEEAWALIQAVVRALRGEASFETLPEDVKALSGVRQFALRIKCATLSWHAMETAISALVKRPAEHTK